MPNRRPAFAFAASAALALAALLAFLAIRPKVGLSVYAMLGDGSSFVSDEERSESAGTAFAVISSGSGPSVCNEAARHFASLLPARFLKSQPADVAGAQGIPSALARFAARAGGLVAKRDFEALSTGEGRARIARDAIRRYVASPMPPAFGPDDDPFCLKDRFLMSFADSGVFVLPVSLANETTSDMDALAAFASAMRGAAASTEEAFGGRVRVMPCGVPVHTASAVSKSKREIGVLSAVSSLLILAIALLAFRPLSRIWYVVASLVFSVSAGATALVVSSPSFHVMTIVFGTAVLGLVVDYSFHWLLCAADDWRRPARNLAISFATTALSLAPLWFSSLPILRETAVFLVSSLAAAFVFAVCFCPVPEKTDPRLETPPCRPQRIAKGALRVVLVAAMAAAAVLASRLKVATDPASLYVPSAELMEPERIIASLFEPPPESVAADVRRLYAEQGEKVARALGLSETPRPPAVRRSAAAELSAVMNALADETARRFALALVAMFAALFAVFRLGAFAVAAPPVFAVAVAAAAVAATGGTANLFHILAAILLAGMCVDYAVFLRSGERGALKSSTCSLLTSLAGFGALAFVSFRPAAAFGTVLGVGLPSGFLAALALRPNLRESGVEKAASPLGMEIVWLFYRVFGLRAMRLLAQCVASCVWAFSPAVRRASPSRRKLVLFARSLADKTAVGSGRVKALKVVDDGSPDAREFADDVTSGRGVFILSSHCGTVEALLALAENPPVFHAWTDFERTSAFNEFYLRHICGGKICLHSVSDIGLDTAFSAIGWLERGECLVMAGDRGRGAFRFAAALGRPVYFATCIADGPGYVAVIRRLRGKAPEIEKGFFAVLGELKAKHPDQVYEWEGVK